MPTNDHNPTKTEAPRQKPTSTLSKEEATTNAQAQPAAKASSRHPSPSPPSSPHHLLRDTNPPNPHLAQTHTRPPQKTPYNDAAKHPQTPTIQPAIPPLVPRAAMLTLPRSLTGLGARPLARAPTAVRPPLRAFSGAAPRHNHGGLSKGVFAAATRRTPLSSLTAAAAISTSRAGVTASPPLSTSRSSSTTAAAPRNPTVLPEFSLAGKIVIVSGAGRGLGLVQAEALLEAGATVYALDRLADPSPEFARVQEKARSLGTRLEYARVDVREVDVLKEVVDGIAKREGGIDGLIAAAGIQQETPAIEYAAEDAK